MIQTFVPRSMDLYKQIWENKMDWELWTPDIINKYLVDWHQKCCDQLKHLGDNVGENPLKWYEYIKLQSEYLSSVISELDSQINDKGYSDVKLKISEYANEINAIIYNNQELKSMIEKYEPKDDEEKRFKMLQLREFRKQPKELLDQYDKLSIDYKNNVIKLQTESKLVLDCKEEYLDGLNENFIKSIKKDDKIVLNQTVYHRLNIMQFANSEELRKTYWQYLQDNQVDNDAIAEQMLVLKQKIAKYFGHENICGYSLECKMAESVEVIEKFLIKIRDLVMPQYLKDIEMLEETYNVRKMMPWDIPYYYEKHKSKTLSFDVNDMDKYFEFEPFMKRFVKFLEELYQIEMRPVDKKTWHESVLVYDCYKNGQFLATMHMDLLQRDHKATGAHLSKMGPRMYNIMGNFTPKPDNGPHYLKVSDVNTLLHECGHNFHDMMSRTNYQLNSGINTFYDFVEVPSQFMENFLCDYESICKLAVDQAGNPIPESLFKKYQQYETFMQSYFIMRQLSFGWSDISLHRNMDWQKEQPEGKFSKIDVFLTKQLKDWVYDSGIQYHQFYRNFTHIFSSLQGYTCGYYSYLWSDVIQASLFEQYQKTKNFEEYIDKVLSKGNAVDANQLIHDYAGGYTFDAFKKRYGIA